MTQEEKIRQKVDACITEYADQCGIDFRFAALGHREHIINCGASVLCTKWEVGYPGGSFVQAVVKNNLSEAFGRADSINQACIKFYVMLLHNIGYIE
jgi:hypothetical protein